METFEPPTPHRRLIPVAEAARVWGLSVELFESAVALGQIQVTIHKFGVRELRKVDARELARAVHARFKRAEEPTDADLFA